MKNVRAPLDHKTLTTCLDVSRKARNFSHDSVVMTGRLALLLLYWKDVPSTCQYCIGETSALGVTCFGFSRRAGLVRSATAGGFCLLSHHINEYSIVGVK